MKTTNRRVFAAVTACLSAPALCQSLDQDSDLVAANVLPEPIMIQENEGKSDLRPEAAHLGVVNQVAHDVDLDDPSHAERTGGGGHDRSAAPGISKRRLGSMEEVVVTATKREERAQDVPMSIAVIGNQEIERRGVVGMEDYLRSVPGVNQVDEGPAGNSVVVRGITVAPSFENFSTGPTVGTYFDETPITGAGSLGAAGIDVRPVDIERIEVLRGPQGTAFGSSSLSGALRIVPAKAQLNDFGTEVSASYSKTAKLGSDNSMIEGVINIPVVTDKLALRAVGYRFDESGFYRNIAGSDPATIATADTYGFGSEVRGYVRNDVGHLLSTGGRISALWQMTDRTSLSVMLFKQKLEQDGSPIATVRSYEQIRMPTAPDARVRGEVGEVADTELDLANMVFTHESRWGTLTSTGSWVKGLFEGARQLTPYASSNFKDSDNDYEALVWETRFASKLAGPLNFLGGVYLDDIQEGFLQSSHWQLAPAPSPVGTNPVSLSARTRDTDQRALFGELTYAITDKLSVTGGGRYFEYDKEENITLREGGLFGVPLGGTIPRKLTNNESDAVYKADIRFKPTDDSMLYASWSEGYRLGRGDAGATPAICDVNGDGIVDGTGVTVESTKQIDADYLENYEIGSKFSLLDRRFIVDVAAYHIDWDGLPIRFFPGTCTTGFFSNVGKATSDGLELQAALYATPALRLEFGGGYNDAELAEDAPGLPGSPKEGTRLPGAPKFNANFSAQYEFDLAGRSAFVRADSFYTDAFYGDLVVPSGAVPAGNYVKVDVRAGIAISSVDLELFVRNLTNDDAFTWRGTSTPIDPNPGYQLRPRTIGIQLRYSLD